MPLVTGRKLAYSAQRAAGMALADLNANPNQNPVARALATAKLTLALDRIQSRIARHQKRGRRSPTSAPYSEPARSDPEGPADSGSLGNPIRHYFSISNWMTEPT